MVYAVRVLCHVYLDIYLDIHQNIYLTSRTTSLLSRSAQSESIRWSFPLHLP